jgi:hypothetical protein
MGISVEHQFAYLASVGANMDWKSLTTQQLQTVMNDPVALGKQHTLFVQAGCQVQIGEYFRETGEVSIQLPALKRPTLKELQSKYNWIKSIERDTSTEEPVTLTFATVLVPDDGNSINGEEYEKRITSNLSSLLGFQHREYLIEHQDESPELKPFLGKIYIDFSGIVVVRRGGGRFVPACPQGGSCWGGLWHWLSLGFYSSGRIAFGK